MSVKNIFAAKAVALVLSLASLGTPAFALAQMQTGQTTTPKPPTYTVSYGQGLAMCPTAATNYYSCPSGVGGVFGAGGWGGYSSSYAQQAAAYIPKPPQQETTYTTEPIGG